MIVADSSYIIEGLLKKSSLLKDKEIITPELAFYEVTNAIWKHEVILKDIKNGKAFLNIFNELVLNQTIKLIRPDNNIIQKAYTLATKKNIAFYDTIFVALAQDLGLELKTYDKKQKQLMA